jgi:hypothetical protein
MGRGGDNILKTENINIGSIPDNTMLFAGLRPQELRSYMVVNVPLERQYC